MPILSLIVPKHQIVLTRAFEELVDEELSEHEVQLGKHASFSQNFRQIVDARFILRNSTSDENMALAAKNTPFSSDSRRAIVVIREENFPMREDLVPIQVPVNSRSQEIWVER